MDFKPTAHCLQRGDARVTCGFFEDKSCRLAQPLAQRPDTPRRQGGCETHHLGEGLNKGFGPQPTLSGSAGTPGAGELTRNVARLRAPVRKATEHMPDTTAYQKFVALLAHNIGEKLSFFFMHRVSIAFVVEGQYAVTIRFGDKERPLEPTFDPDADLRMAFTMEALQEFIDNTLDPVAALESQRIAAEGDVKLFELMSPLLTPVSNSLGLRASLARF